MAAVDSPVFVAGAGETPAGSGCTVSKPALGAIEAPSAAQSGQKPDNPAKNRQPDENGDGTNNKARAFDD